MSGLGVPSRWEMFERWQAAQTEVTEQERERIREEEREAARERWGAPMTQSPGPQTPGEVQARQDQLARYREKRDLVGAIKMILVQPTE